MPCQKGSTYSFIITWWKKRVKIDQLILSPLLPRKDLIYLHAPHPIVGPRFSKTHNRF